MAGVVHVTIACLVLSTRADPCRDDQKCSECITTLGNCITECDTGYYDPKCKSVCSKNCKLKKCKQLEGSGREYCTEGCEPGYHGGNCNVGCLVPTGKCTNCPGGCEEEYCYQGDKCFSGCHAFYFGSDCKNCSSRCDSCNRTTGTCDHCHPPYHGLNCEYSRNNSSGSCEAGCAPGLYGDLCVDMCSEKCRSNPAVIPEKRCIGADVNISNLCIPECHRESGECVHGCVAGWYGPLCSFECKSNCINKRCNITGECAEGCTEGHFGKDCKPCSENCANYTCISNSGTCFKVCHNGMDGQFCNLIITLCNDHMCDLPTGKCINGCFVTEEGCTPNCSNGFPTTERTTESSGTDKSMASGIYLYAGSLIAVLCVAIAVCYICYRKGMSTSSNQPDDAGHSSVTGQDETLEYQALHRYWEIREADMNMTFEPSNRPGQDETKEYQALQRHREIRGADTIAECGPSHHQEFSEEEASIFHVTEEGVPGEDGDISSSGATETYTTTGARYISPITDDSIEPYSE